QAFRAHERAQRIEGLHPAEVLLAEEVVRDGRDAEVGGDVLERRAAEPAGAHRVAGAPLESRICASVVSRIDSPAAYARYQSTTFASARSRSHAGRQPSVSRARLESRRSVAASCACSPTGERTSISLPQSSERRATIARTDTASSSSGPKFQARASDGSSQSLSARRR